MMVQYRSEGVPFRFAAVEDEGEAYGVFLVQHGEQVGYSLFPYQPGREDEAFELANQLRDSWVSARSAPGSGSGGAQRV